MFNNIKKVLVLAPHTDDGELGCGGAISNFLDSGKKVFYVAFSSAEKWLVFLWLLLRRHRKHSPFHGAAVSDLFHDSQ